MRIEVYGRDTCGFCVRAAALARTLTGRDVSIQVPKRSAMSIAESEGHTTVPIVFVDGKFLGGSDALEKLLVAASGGKKRKRVSRNVGR